MTTIAFALLAIAAAQLGRLGDDKVGRIIFTFIAGGLLGLGLFAAPWGEVA